MLSDMQLVFLILIVTTICFLVPRFRSDLVAICSLLTLLLLGLVTVPEAFSGFSNSVVIMIAALFVVGEGVFQTGLAQRAGQVLVKWTGKSELRLTLFMIALVAILSGFMSNTGTVAILLPVVVSLCRQLQLHPGKLLMPLAFASSMGGALTLIGTAPNLIASQSLHDHGYGALSFFSFTPVGLIILAAGTAYLWFIARRWLNKPHERERGAAEPFNADKLLQEYQVEPFIHTVQVTRGFKAIGKSLRDMAWPNTYDVTVLEVLRENARLFGLKSRPEKTTAGPNLVLQSGDILFIYGTEENVTRLILENGLKQEDMTNVNKKGHLEYANMAEVILTPDSQLINQSIEDIHFRDKYGLTILAIKHQYKQPGMPTPHEKLLYGDSLLLYGKWKDINLLSQEKRDTVVLRHAAEASLGQDKPIRAIIAGVILAWMLIMMVFEWLPAVVTVVIAAILMLLTGSVRQTDQAYRSINWQTVVLIACMLPMATALDKTGGVAFISEGLINALGTIGPLAVLAGLYLITSAFSQFISNTATAVLLFPVAILTAQQMDVSPIPMVMAVAFSASMAFATPVATPPNAMVMAAGKYTFFDFVKVGIPLQLIIAIIAVIFLPLFFPF
jgi:di/tricarboxylate transporter